MISTDADIGTGLGAWKRTGRRDFHLKFLVLIPPGNVIGLPPYGTVIVTADLTVNDSGDEDFERYREVDLYLGEIGI